MKIESIIKAGEYKFRDIAKNPEKWEQDHPDRAFMTRDTCTPNAFSNYLILHASSMMVPLSEPFVVDDSNKTIIEQLYYWITGDEANFDGQIGKGILLIGTYGSGKTLLMNALAGCLNKFSYWSSAEAAKKSDRGRYLIDKQECENASFSVHKMEARDISLTIGTRDTAQGPVPKCKYETGSPLFVDDIGKERLQHKDYGNVSYPWEELVVYRYTKNLFTMGTSNFKLEDMPYSGHCKDRMKQMFNFIVLPGKSRRV